MATGNRVNLLTLADREYRQLTETPSAPPVRRKFKPINLALSKFDASWDCKRGAAVRLMGVLLREDDTTLEQRVCENERSAKTYAEAAEWLQRESAYLRKLSKLLDTRGGRLTAVIGRCRDKLEAKNLVP